MRIRLPRPLTLAQIAQHCGGVLDAACASPLQAVLHIATDSREIERGDLFVALSRGEHFKAEFLMDAVKNGASALMVEPNLNNASDTCKVITPNVLEALASLAAWHLKQVSPRVIAVTGSVGKTTTRHLLATILRTSYRIHESPHNYNNLLGICLTILTMPYNCEYLVTECGMDGPNQIARLSRLLKPDAAIITNIGMSHIEKLGSIEAIRNAKLEIEVGMHGGPLFYPAEAQLLTEHVPHTALSVHSQEHPSAPYITNVDVNAQGTSFDYVSRHHYLKGVTIPALGTHIAYCAKLAIALAESEGIDTEGIIQGCANFETVDNRLHLHPFKRLSVIDDTYNAAPDSMLSALNTMVHIASSQKAALRIAVLGDMLELGGYATACHRRVGEAAKGVCTHLIVLGEHAREYAGGAIRAGMPKEQVLILSKEASLDNHIKRLYQLVASTSAVVLFKGSHSTPLSAFAQKFIAFLRSIPERKL